MRNHRLKHIIVAVALVVTFHAITRGQMPAPEPGRRVTEEQELKALDLSWHEAVAAHNADALGRLLADDYGFELDARRRLTKAQEIEAVRAQDSLFDFGKFKLSEVGVGVEGEKATVSGILTARPAGMDKKASPRYFYTRTLVRRDDRWQILSSHLVSLAPGAR